MKTILLSLVLLFSSLGFAGDPNLERFTVVQKDKFGVEQKYLTGYIPGDYSHAMYREFPANKGALAFEPIPEELDGRPYIQRIFSQQCGDCWAQGSSTMMEMLVSFYDKVSIFVSRQNVIDCSNFGSCGGGQISVEHFVKPKGAVYEEDYKYVGNNQRCKTGAPIHQSAEKAFLVSRSSLTVSGLQRAMMETSFLEICGSAGALGNGGWVERNPSGSTNHCYGLGGWLRGEKHGHKVGTYFIIVNSWGKNWGDNGLGYYLMAKDGEHFDGDVITEAGGVTYKPACTPQPVADAGKDKTIVLED